MAGLVARFGPVDGGASPAPPELYGALVRAITGQQLSVRAARAIHGRLVERFGGHPPTPAELLADDPEEMRTAVGLSHAKVASLRSLARHVIDGDLEIHRLEALDDAEVIRELVAVKGIGAWTAQMFLMFTLHRPDVVATGDLGIRTAARRAYGLDTLPDAAALTALAEPWRPYRTRACLYLWRSLDNVPVTAADG
jgi:DNA-3-methyladenine glycosylase II